MRRTAPAGCCPCGLPDHVPVGSALHQPRCPQYRIPGWKPKPERPEHAACRARTDDERVAVVRSEYRRIRDDQPPVEPVDAETTGVAHG